MEKAIYDEDSQQYVVVFPPRGIATTGTLTATTAV
jgi:hypothetical protein